MIVEYLAGARVRGELHRRGARSTRTASSAPARQPFTWIPFGGGVRRCIGAAFANMEMNVTLRTLLREFEFGTTYAPANGVTTAVWRSHRHGADARWCTGERWDRHQPISADRQGFRHEHPKASASEDRTQRGPERAGGEASTRRRARVRIAAQRGPERAGGAA